MNWWIVAVGALVGPAISRALSAHEDWRHGIMAIVYGSAAFAVAYFKL